MVLAFASEKHCAGSHGTPLHFRAARVARGFLVLPQPSPPSHAFPPRVNETICQRHRVRRDLSRAGVVCLLCAEGWPGSAPLRRRRRSGRQREPRRSGIPFLSPRQTHFSHLSHTPFPHISEFTSFCRTRRVNLPLLDTPDYSFIDESKVFAVSPEPPPQLDSPALTHPRSCTRPHSLALIHPPSLIYPHSLTTPPPQTPPPPLIRPTLILPLGDSFEFDF